MLRRADAVRPTDPEKAMRIQRAATILWLLDFRGSVVATLLDELRHSPAKIETLGLSAANREALMQALAEIERSHASPVDTISFVESLPAAYEPDANGRCDATAIIKSARLGVDAWRTKPANLAGRRSLAAELWRLRCLADADLDEAGRHEVRRVLEQLASHAVDPASQKWAAEVLSLQGPRPRAPGWIIVTPDDLKPKRPD
jgi:hypothetical protein